MSLVQWVLIGLGVWLVVSVVGAFAVGVLLRVNRLTTLDVLRAQGLVNAPPPPSPSDPRVVASDADLPGPRDAEHDRAAAPTERRRD